MSGLNTIAWIDGELLAGLAGLAEPRQPTAVGHFDPVTVCEDGVVVVVELSNRGFVRVTLATEAGRVLIVDLLAPDAAVISSRLLSAGLTQPNMER